MKRFILLITTVQFCLCGNSTVDFSHDFIETEDKLLHEALEAIPDNKKLAAQLLTQFLNLYPGSSMRYEAMMALGDCYYGINGNYLQALDIYTRIPLEALTELQQQDLLYRTAYALMQERQYADADRLFDQLSSSIVYSKAAKFYRGYIAYREKRYPEALALFEMAKSKEAPGIQADFYIGQIDYNRRNYQEALDAMHAYLNSDDLNTRAEALRISGECEFHLDHQSAARQYLNEYEQLISTLNPSISLAPSAQYILGLFAFYDEDYSKAAKLMQAPAEGNDAMAQTANLYLGQSLLHLGDKNNIDAAIMAFDRAIALDFDSSVREAAYYNYAISALKGGKVPFGNATTMFENFLKEYPSSQYAPQVQKHISSSYIANHDYEGALHSIDAMVSPTAATLATKAEVLNAIASNAISKNDYAKAIEALQKTKKLAKHNPSSAHQASLLLSQAYYSIGNYKKAASEAMDYIYSAKKDDANLSQANFDLAYALLAQQKPKEALSYFSFVVDNPATLPIHIISDALTRKADCQYYEGLFAESAESYLQAYEMKQDNADYALFHQALMKGYLREHQQKIDLIHKLKQEFPLSSLLPEAMLELTESYTQLGKTDEAINAYSDLISQYPSSSQARQGQLQLALTLQNNGRQKEAIDAYKSLIIASPVSQEANQAIENLKQIYTDEGELPALIAFLNDVPESQQIDTAEAAATIYESALNAENAGKGALALRLWKDLANFATDENMLLNAQLGIIRTATLANEWTEVEKAATLALSSNLLAVSDRPFVLYRRGEARKAQGNYQQAANDWKQIANNTSDYFGLAATVGLADLALSSFELEEAESWAKKATEADTPHAYWVARAFIILSDIYKTQGDDFKAKQYIHSLKKNYPGNEEDILQMIEERLH